MIVRVTAIYTSFITVRDEGQGQSTRDPTLTTSAALGFNTTKSF